MKRIILLLTVSFCFLVEMSVTHAMSSEDRLQRLQLRCGGKMLYYQLENTLGFGSFTATKVRLGNSAIFTCGKWFVTDTSQKICSSVAIDYVRMMIAENKQIFEDIDSFTIVLCVEQDVKRFRIESGNQVLFEACYRMYRCTINEDKRNAEYYTMLDEHNTFHTRRGDCTSRLAVLDDNSCSSLEDEPTRETRASSSSTLERNSNQVPLPTEQTALNAASTKKKRRQGCPCVAM